MSQEPDNAPRNEAALLPVPEGLSRCPICGEYRGVMRLGHVSGFDSSIFRYEEPSTSLTVQCICDGVLCPICKKNRFHRPISNTWTERGGFGHVPYFRGWFPCDECYRKRNEEYAARQREKGDEKLTEHNSNPK